MSCDARFRTLCATIGGAGGPLAGAFLDAPAALQVIQEVARNGAPAVPTLPRGHTASPHERAVALKVKVSDTVAERETQQLFDLMQQRYGLHPPTHGRKRPDGRYLPRRDACYGYQAVWQTIQAVEHATPLPMVAFSVQCEQERAHEAAIRQQRRAAERARRPSAGVPDDPGAAEFDDLVDCGRYFPYYGAESKLYQLGSVTFEAQEAEIDGFRSYFTSVQRRDSHGGIFYRQPLAEVTPRCTESADGTFYELVDRDGRVWLEFGTVNIDEYYSDFVFHPYAFAPDDAGGMS